MLKSYHNVPVFPTHRAQSLLTDSPHTQSEIFQPSGLRVRTAGVRAASPSSFSFSFLSFSLILLYWPTCFLQTHKIISHFFYLLLLQPGRSFSRCLQFTHSHCSNITTRRGLHWPPYLKCAFSCHSILPPGFIFCPSTYCWQMFYTDTLLNHLCIYTLSPST